MRALLVCLLAAAADASASGSSLTPGIGPDTLAVVVNRSDPLSVRIGEYYASSRKIPAKHVLRVDFAPGGTTLTPKQFAKLKRSLDAQTPDGIQGYALAWLAPYRVACMSITTAFAAGFDRAWCASGCRLTRKSEYFDSPTQRPYADLGLRPAMMLAASSFAEARALIDRGVIADGTHPRGVAYLLSTSDRRRNVRSAGVGDLQSTLGDGVTIRYLEQDYISGRRNVLFYFTGTKNVEKLFSNHFLPGAVGDHLTSAGGKLTGSRQMSSLRWLEAGATGSYGTVVEPCNFHQKFPVPEVLMRRYTSGESLIEAYWKSVEMPGQGIFIGEPLARPFAAIANHRL